MLFSTNDTEPVRRFTRYGTRRRWLSQGEKLGLRIERELGIPLRENPRELRKLGKFQRGHGVIAWIALAEDGTEVSGEQPIGETLRSRFLTAIRPQQFMAVRCIDIIGDDVPSLAQQQGGRADG